MRVQAYSKMSAIETRASRLMDKLQRVLISPDLPEAGKIQLMISELEKFVVALGRPEFNGHRLDPRADATFQELNRLFASIACDHEDIMAEYLGLANMITGYFNRNQSALNGAMAEVQNTSARALAASLANGLAQRGQFVIVENFATDGNMSEDSTAEIGFGGGVLTLQRL